MFYLFKSAWNYADKDKWKLVVCYISHSFSFWGELLQPFAFGMAVNALQTNGIEHLEPMISWFELYLVGFFIFELWLFAISCGLIHCKNVTLLDSCSDV